METVNNHTDSIMVTRVRTIHGRWGMPLAVTIDEVAAAMRRAAAESSGGSQRCAGQCTRSGSANSLRDRRPYIIFSSLFHRSGIEQFTVPTGLVLLTAALGGDPMDASLLRRRVEQVPQTLMAFADDSCRVLNIIVRCRPAEGAVPADSFAYVRFLARAQRQAARFFEAMTDYNPVHEFLAGCGTWDQRHDFIGDLAARVPNSHPQWRRLFHRWFLGMVAQWLGRSSDYGNAVVPMLIGPQGCRKSTFCKMLLPRSLREYYIDDLKLDNAEQAERVLGRMALWELQQGERYWMDGEEEHMMEDYNQRFLQTTTAEFIVSSMYRPAERKKENFVRAIDMLKEIQDQFHGTDRPNMTQLLRALKAQHFEYGAIAGQRGWYAVKRDFDLSSNSC